MTNPWAEAAFNNANESILTETQRQRQEEISCWFSTLALYCRAMHTVDAILGAFLVIYGVTILSSHLHVPIIFCLSLGISLLMRAFAGFSGMKSDALYRFGLRMSSFYLSPILGLVFFILSCLCMGKHAVLVEYLKNHASALHLSTSAIHFIEHHHHALWILFLIGACMEAIRWWTIPIFHSWLLQLDTSLGSPDVELLYTPQQQQQQQKPWWWQAHHGDLHDPLLPHHLNSNSQPHWVQNTSRSYSLHDGTSPQSKDTSFFSRWFGRQSNERDDESVDFASVQEEWASKSQEDPFWWSRDESEQQQQQRPTNNGNVNTSSDAKDTSWATEQDPPSV